MKDHTTGAAPMKLSDATLGQLPASIKVPSYDRSVLTPGMVHIGLGNFHRAHQAWYLHTLMQMGLDHDWAIIGAGVRAPDAKMRDRLAGQDFLTTLVELDPQDVSFEVCGSMIGFVPVEPNNTALIAQMADPAIRIVSLTVTEGGYFTDEAGDFDASHPDIQHDIANPTTPVTAFGAIIEAYRQRRAAGERPFTCLCCDNLQGNGDILKQTVLGLAALIDADLAAWIDANATFPNTMVDCIVPATGETELAMVRDAGIEDAAPVTHERFRQWVIEDNFCNGRPAWEKAGATLTDNVHAYEAMKIRVLNAGHQVLANVGEILGLETIADCMSDPMVSAFLRKVETDEILPYIGSVPGVTPTEYLALIEERFANPRILDTTRRVAFDGSSRHPGFVLPILRDAIAAEETIEGLSLVEALWAHMCAGRREDGTLIEPNDPEWDDLHEAAKAASTDAGRWTGQTHIYSDLSANARFNANFSKWLAMLNSLGARKTLDYYLSA